jgi:hypothetical protein
MAESAAAPAPAAPAAAPAAPAAPASAGAQLTSVPAGQAWAASFKNEALKTYVQEKKFTDVEQLAERYQNLEKLRGVPDDRLLKLPEKMEGVEARAIWERLGAPKEAKGYEIPRIENGDNSFADWAETVFHKAGVPKSQALEIVNAYSEFGSNFQKAQSEGRIKAMQQGDEALKKEWGAAYEQNVGVAKQGVRILGLDAKTLDLMEAGLGREALYKNLQKIGLGMAESTFVDGTPAPSAKSETAQEAADKIKQLQSDRKFGKKLSRGDVEASNEWNRLHKIAFPGDKTV